MPIKLIRHHVSSKGGNLIPKIHVFETNQSSELMTGFFESEPIS